MTNLVLSVLLTGLAVTYLLELIDKIQLGILEKSTINLVASMPLSLGCLFLLGQWSLKLIVLVPAATFVALVLNMLVNKPLVIKQPRIR